MRKPPLVRPKTRRDCLPGGCNAQRPCPWVSCKHHLYLDVSRSGDVHCGFDDLEHMADTCALDVAETGEHSLEQIGQFTGYVREQVRLIELDAFHRIIWDEHFLFVIMRSFMEP